MDDLTPRRTSGELLRREVEPPHPPPTGVGIMLLASAAMFFAVAGSAFILRARMVDSGCPYRAPSTIRAIAPSHDELRPAPADLHHIRPASPDCEMKSHTGPDGTQVVEFRVCPE